MRLSTVGALFFILVTGIAGTAAAEPPDGVELLRQAVAQEDHVAFVGREEIVLWVGEHATASMVKEAHDGQGRSRVDTLAPRRERGRLTLSDGKVEWHYDPATRKAYRDADVPPDVELDDIEPLLQNYEVKAAPKPNVVADRRAWVVTLTPKTAGKSHRRLWIDDATSVILKQEKFHADDLPIDRSTFTRIHFRQPPPSLFEVRFPPGTRRVTRSSEMPIKLGAVETQFHVRLPQTLAAGYEFESASLMESHGKHAAHVRYRDGLSTVSLFIAPQSGETPYGSRSGSKIALRGGEGRIVREHHIKTLAWRTPTVDCALVGDVSDALLRTLAEGTNLTQGAQESHHRALPRVLWLVPAGLFLLAGLIALVRRVYPRVPHREGELLVMR